VKFDLSQRAKAMRISLTAFFWLSLIFRLLPSPVWPLPSRE
jgi:hypothetical protein